MLGTYQTWGKMCVLQSMVERRMAFRNNDSNNYKRERSGQEQNP